MTPDQLAQLLHPSAYAERTEAVRLVQTHASWILITDRHAYKIKKPVNFGFLDFSTLEQRHFYCREELRLNRRLCPDLYEAVVEVRDTSAGAAFHGTGAVLDYAVRMKRLPDEGMFDRLVQQNAVTGDDMRQIADIVARFHRTAATSPEIAACGSVASIRYNWRENLEQLTPFGALTLPDDERERLAAWVEECCDRLAPLFARRIADGYIRECDGDLHLENICRADGRVYIFDCIEFNERFRYCDTVADVAFLAMDLEYHDRPDLARAFIDAYAAASGDSGMAPLLDFYKAYRAVVRGKVASLRLADPGIPAAEREQARWAAIRYFRLARGYQVRERLPATLFITCGLMGCGKSTLARQLAFELGIPRFNSDVTRKVLFDREPASTATPYGSGLYTPDRNDATYRELERLAGAALAAGTSAIVDASFRSRAERDRFARLAAASGARFVIIELSCPESLQLQRLDERQQAGNSPSDGRRELAAAQRELFEAPADREGVVVRLTADRPAEALTEALYREVLP